MKYFFAVLIFLITSSQINAQPQLDVEGSNDTTARIINRSSGFTKTVYGLSVSASGLNAVPITASNTSEEPTILAKNSGVGIAVYGHSPLGIGLYGLSTHYWGVYGYSTSDIGVVGRSYSNYGSKFSGADGFADIILGGHSGNDDGVIRSEPSLASSDIWLQSNDGIVLVLDKDSSETGDLEVVNDIGETVFRVSENGNVYVNGVMVHSSDQGRKENLGECDSEDILNKLSSMPIYYWNFKNDSVMHLGPVAQDFHQIFNVGENNTTIATVDADGIMMAAIKALYEQNSALKTKLEFLENRLESLQTGVPSDFTSQNKHPKN